MTRPSCFTLIGGGLLAIAFLAGCQKQAGTNPPAASAAITQPMLAKAGSAPASRSLRDKPDFGGVTTQHVEVSATGPTLESAVDNAIRLAVEQVNGKRVDAASLQMNVGAGTAGAGEPVDVTSSGYANWVASATSGAVNHFRLLSQKQINIPRSTNEESLKASQGASWNKGQADASAEASASADGASVNANDAVKGNWDEHQGASQVDYRGTHTDYATQWEVRIGADVATYREAASAKLTRVVVAQPQVHSATYQIGDNTISSDAIASEIRQKVAEALTDTHRFTVLDRTADPQISQEIGLIQSGNTTPADTARLGQQLAADLIVIPAVDRFEYVRHEHPLRLADRTLVSYSGGSEVSFKVVNAVTGQMVMSRSFNYAFPETSPTTLGISVDGNKLADDMMEAMNKKIIASIIQSTYPLSVLQLQGRNVVINQGGDAVQEGAMYEAVFLGKPIVDPQSGQSLGPTETPCCSVAIDRVTPNLAYGHIVEHGVHIAAPYVPGSIELRQQIAMSESSSARFAPSGNPASGKAAQHARRVKPKTSGDNANW